MTLANNTYNSIINALETGKAVSVSTNLKHWAITPKTYLKFKAANHPLFKIGSDGCLYMAQGKSYVCISYAEMALAQIRIAR
jgi:hypothetical protein